jgi:hypothetical protein
LQVGLFVFFFSFSFPPFVSLAPCSLLQPILPGYCTRVLSFLSFLLWALTD